ncbi:phosphatidate cytidylyltransferase [Sedimenticola sp.]|uniref:phosphatidate cytidylyltransferase n=1 Tax=Sedimenticola sp. TaxID=1940285 RepID=UPI00258976C1|nr:phosphatidate cytidylyltransferase [Sedimenticola sp.]MCW8904627.1 phosphatidate cytidylyltransferase [Sedimenticola sp.]
MLLHRILTALVLLPLVIGGVLYLPTTGFALLLAAVILLGADEWTRLAEFTKFPERIFYLLTMALAMAVLYVVLPNQWVSLGLFAGAAFGWFVISLIIIRYRPEKPLEPGRPVKLLIGYFVLLPTWAALVYLHNYGPQGPALVLFALSLSWVADTGAYFAGRQWGKIKLSPHISPKKTREGVYGALAAVALWSGLLIWLRPETGTVPQVVTLCLLVCLVSVVGDLFESLLKRQAGIKDSGNLLPGHGGILDRIDSLTAVAPVFTLGLLLLGGGR